MVGGGEGAFIGAVHRSAAGLDQAHRARLRRVRERRRAEPPKRRELGVTARRCYADFNSMFAAEAKLPADERMEFVAIVTPNDLHLAVATAAFKHGFHVLSDKPATTTLAECFELRDAQKASGCLYGLTHPYGSYPLVVEAAERVRAGQLGTVRKVLVEYTQGWLAEPIERRGQKQAIWRLDPKRAGLSSCMGDIGVHAFHLAEFVTNLRTTELCADLNSIVAGRELDDDGAAFLRFDNGARGVLVASQICTGEENDLRLRVYGDAASLEWHQQEPNSLWLKHGAQADRADPQRRARLRRRGARAFALAGGPPRGLSRSVRERLPPLRGAGTRTRRQRQRRPGAARRARHQGRAARHGVHRDRRRREQVRAEVARVPRRHGRDARKPRSAHARASAPALVPASAAARPRATAPAHRIVTARDDEHVVCAVLQTAIRIVVSLRHLGSPRTSTRGSSSSATRSLTAEIRDSTRRARRRAPNVTRASATSAVAQPRGFACVAKRSTRRRGPPRSRMPAHRRRTLTSAPDAYRFAEVTCFGAKLAAKRSLRRRARFGSPYLESERGAVVGNVRPVQTCRRSFGSRSAIVGPSIAALRRRRRVRGAARHGRRRETTSGSSAGEQPPQTRRPARTDDWARPHTS